MTETDGTTLWMTLEQAAAYAKTSSATLRREAKNGRLRGYKIGGRRVWRFNAARIDECRLRGCTHA